MNERSRAGMLVIAAALVAGTGCITATVVSEVNQRNNARADRERARNKSAALRAEAAQGTLYARTQLAWYEVSGEDFTITVDRAAGLARLEAAAAQDYLPAQYFLAKALMYGDQPTTAERARGLELWKQVASRSCEVHLWHAWDPALDLATLLRDGAMGAIRTTPDPLEAELWTARSIIHCGKPNSYFRSLVSNRLPEPARRVQMLAWAQLADYGFRAGELREQPTIEERLAATREADRLRRRVRDSERQYPAPPPVSRPIP